jgi:hypothetical protein
MPAFSRPQQSAYSEILSGASPQFAAINLPFVILSPAKERIAQAYWSWVSLKGFARGFRSRVSLKRTVQTQSRV